MAESTSLPIRKDLKLVRGDSKDISFYVEDNQGTDDEPDFQPRDWLDPDADYVFLAEIRADLNRGELLATWDVEASNDGWVYLHLPYTEADNLGDDKSVAHWDVQYTFTDEDDVEQRKTHYYGKVTVQGDTSNE